VGRILAAALFVVVRRRRRRRTREEYSVSTNHQVPKRWFPAVLGVVLKFLKLTSGSGISSILTNQRTFVSGFLIYPQIKEPLVAGFSYLYIHKSKNL
jgi:hypothetical protein